MSQDAFLLAQCVKCGERYEKKSLEDKGEHTCSPKPSELDSDSEAS